MKNSIKRKKFQRDKLLRMINSRLMSVKIIGGMIAIMRARTKITREKDLLLYFHAKILLKTFSKI